MIRISQFALLVALVGGVAACSNGLPRPLAFLDRGGNEAPAAAQAAADTALTEEDAEDEDGAEEGAETDADAVTDAPVAAGVLGETVASLGDPTDIGLWLETPLVSAETPGRIAADNGRTASVTLRPSGGEPGSGSRISLAAMQALGLGLTDLPTLTVIAGQ